MEENKYEDFQLSSTENRIPANTQVDELNGKKITADDFKLVQQDKSIHDLKFTTKPTTFFKDARHRFVKNRSSVVGGVILGVLFVLSLILPINGVVPFDITSKHNYETNLPPKIAAASNGFWDGTRWHKNEAYPYDKDGNYIGQYASDDYIVKIDNVREGYGDGHADDANGGFVRLVGDKKDKEEIRYRYSYPYTYDLNNTYTLSYTLGQSTDQEGVRPDYSLLFFTNNQFVALDRTSVYPAIAEKATAEGQKISTYETVTLDITDALKKNEKISALLGSGKTIKGSLGIRFYTKNTSSTALYLKNFDLSSSSSSKIEKRELGYRSFDDANARVGESKTVNGKDNPRYWTTKTDTAVTPCDVITKRCDVLYDEYQIAYGLKADRPVARSTRKDWKEKGYITFDEKNPTKGFSITEEGSKRNDVYVVSVDSATATTIEGVSTFSLKCTVRRYKYLGYTSIPKHLLGTEAQGKDRLKYVFSGLRTSLILGVIVSAINILIGVVWGSISGFFGGLTDLTRERIVDILSGMPWIILMTVLTLKLGQNFFVFALALCLTGWIGTESITRSQFYRYKNREYVLAAKTLGAKAPRLIFRHILPNAIGTIVTSSVLRIPSVIFNEATISYLGLGLKNADSLGVILSDVQNVRQNYPYQRIVPAVIISLLMICFNLFGNGLRDAFNPSLKGTD